MQRLCDTFKCCRRSCKGRSSRKLLSRMEVQPLGVKGDYNFNLSPLIKLQYSLTQMGRTQIRVKFKILPRLSAGCAGKDRSWTSGYEAEAVRCCTSLQWREEDGWRKWRNQVHSWNLGKNSIGHEGSQPYPIFHYKILSLNKLLCYTSQNEGKRTISAQSYYCVAGKSRKRFGRKHGGGW